ncbi:hypothetical transcript [Echinococcus multilocularis]|uniref:Hypothetical transcript n=1 Tax=Echinococcus multilocularis TaxID=6211 RepID=A0A068Y282_ECHMU|nr:hypothetical transcript [Echinococcus multilocularis]
MHLRHGSSRQICARFACEVGKVAKRGLRDPSVRHPPRTDGMCVCRQQRFHKTATVTKSSFSMPQFNCSKMIRLMCGSPKEALADCSEDCEDETVKRGAHRPWGRRGTKEAINWRSEQHTPILRTDVLDATASAPSGAPRRVTPAEERRMSGLKGSCKVLASAQMSHLPIRENVLHCAVFCHVVLVTQSKEHLLQSPTHLRMSFQLLAPMSSSQSLHVLGTSMWERQGQPTTPSSHSHLQVEQNVKERLNQPMSGHLDVQTSPHNQRPFIDGVGGEGEEVE